MAKAEELRGKSRDQLQEELLTVARDAEAV